MLSRNGITYNLKLSPYEHIIKYSNGENIKYERFVGGAPLNVACGIKNLEGAVGFIGSVGDDIIGNFLYEYCLTKGFEYLDVRLDSEHNTTLAFVENDPNGERSFCFFKQNTADTKSASGYISFAVA